MAPLTGELTIMIRGVAVLRAASSAAGLAVVAFAAATLLPVIAADTEPTASAPEKQSAGVAQDAAVPDDVRAGIEKALKGKVETLLKEKTPEGANTKRGTYSRSFRKVDDSTYQVTFHVDTASERTMKTERYLLTLKKEGLEWKIANEELKDTYTDLHRIWLEDSKFARFDGFSFNKEGLKVSAGKGSFYKVYRDGELEAITAWAPDIAYVYTPPTAKYATLWEKMKQNHADDVLFNPGYIRITCDPRTCEDFLKTAFRGVTESLPRDAVDPVVRDRYDVVLAKNRKSRTEDYLRGFQPRDEPDHRNWDLELGKSFFENGDPGTAINLGYDSDGVRQVSFSAYSLFEMFPSWQTLYYYYPEDVRASKPDYAELERRDEYLSRYYDLAEIAGSVDMGISESELMKADITFKFTAKRDITKLPFFMVRLKAERPDAKEAKSPRMFVNSVQDGTGRELTFVKFGATAGLVLFPEPIAKGSSFELRMQFENRDALYKLTPSFTYVSRGGWLPFARFGDLTMFDLDVRVPEHYTTLGIGDKTSDVVKDGVRTTHWSSGKPVAFPTVIFGQYTSVESTVVAKKSDGTKIPVWLHVDRDSMGQWGITRSTMEGLANEAANAINLYTAIYGVDYPYNKLDLVNDPQPALYGQAPSSIIYLGSLAFKKATLATAEMGRRGTGGADMTQFVKSLVAHETAHQWWGSAITNRNSFNYWFVESIAEWSAALFVENMHSEAEYLEHVEAWRKEILQTDMQVSVQDAAEMWGGDLGAYRAAVYSKGPYMFYMLRNTFGDEKMFAFLKSLCQDLAGKEIVSRDIQQVAEKSFGGTMEWFFDQWLRGVGLPEFKFQYTSRQTEDGKYLIEGTIDQRIVLGKKKDEMAGVYFRGIVPITIKAKDGKEYPQKVRVEAVPQTPFRIKIGVAPAEISLNKYGESLAWDVVKPQS